MSNKNPENKEIITETGIGNDSGVNHSNAQAKGEAKASPEALKDKALETALETIETLKLELAEARAAKEKPASDNGIEKLAQAILEASNGRKVGPTEADEVNRSTDFKNTRAMVDGRSLMEQQQMLLMFRNENKKPISIPKSFQNSIGPTLSVTVNGVRVSIPCDGKTYYINETHWEHARERIAKVDILNATPEDNVVELG